MEEHKNKGQQGQSEAFERRLKLTNAATAIAILSKGSNGGKQNSSDDKSNNSREERSQRGR